MKVKILSNITIKGKQYQAGDIEDLKLSDIQLKTLTSAGALQSFNNEVGGKKSDITKKTKDTVNQEEGKQ